MREARRTFLRHSAVGITALAIGACAPAPIPSPSPPTPPPAPPTTSTKPAATTPAKPAEKTTVSPKPTLAATTPAPVAKKVERVKWRHADTAIGFEAAFKQMAHRKGFLDEEGIGYEVSVVTSGTTMVRALVAGELESAQFGASAMFPAVESGAEIRIIAAPLAKLLTYLYVQKSINGIQDLAGKSIGGGQSGSTLQVVAEALLRKYNVPVDSVTFVNIGGSPDVYRAIAEGRVAAGVAQLDYLRLAERDQSVKGLLDCAKELPDYLRLTYITSADRLRNKRDEVKRYLRAQIKGHRYALTHRDETIAFAVELTKGQRDDMEWQFDQYFKNRYVDPDFGVSRTALEYTQQLNLQAESQKAMLPADRVADVSIQQEVVRELGGPFRYA